MFTVSLCTDKARRVGHFDLRSAAEVAQWLSDVGAYYAGGFFWIDAGQDRLRVELRRGACQLDPAWVVANVLACFRGEVRTLSASARVRRAYAKIAQ